jgi:hypothetical protein
MRRWIKPMPPPDQRHPKRLPLTMEITLALLLKIALLALLWDAFFSTPQAPKMAMPSATVEQHLLSDHVFAEYAPSTSSTSSTPSPPEPAHDTRR